jgi:hypothetical protein
MGSFKEPRLFDPFDLDILDRAYEAAWAKMVSRDPDRDVTKDERRRASLLKRVFATVHYGATDPEAICDKVLASMPEFWT